MAFPGAEIHYGRKQNQKEATGFAQEPDLGREVLGRFLNVFLVSPYSLLPQFLLLSHGCLWWSTCFSVPHSFPPSIAELNPDSLFVCFYAMIDCLAPRILLWSKGTASFSTKSQSQKKQNKKTIFFPFPLFSYFLNKPLPPWVYVLGLGGRRGERNESGKLSIQQSWSLLNPKLEVVHTNFFCGLSYFWIRWHVCSHLRVICSQLE